MSTYRPFIYVIGWTDLNIWYLGARYARGTQPLDLWTTYFTSSKLVQQLRSDWSEPDYFECWETEDSDQARTWEIELIKGLELHKDSRWLNRGCFKTYHASPEEKSAMMNRHFEDPAALERNQAKRREVNSRPEVRETRRQSAERLNQDPSYKEALRAGQSKRWSDPKARERFSQINSEVGNRPEEKEARRQRAKALWQDPAFRAKMMASRQRKSTT